MIGLRRREPWLVTAGTEVLTLANEQLSVRLSGPDDAELVLLLNIADDPFPFDVAAAAEVLLSQGDAAAADSSVTVDGHSWAIVRMDG